MPGDADYGKLDITIDGRHYSVDVEAVSGGFFSLLINGQSHDVLVSREGEHFSVVVEGNFLEVDFYDPRTMRRTEDVKDSLAGSRQTICAPMAGRIVRFQVQCGDMVKKGDGLIVLEAMKMENEIKSQGVGRVREVLVGENEIVSPGQKIMVIE